MLFFLYKRPPDSVIEFERLAAIVWRRYEHYYLPANLQRDTEQFNFDDKLSHFIMCIVAIKHPHFKDLFMQGETKLFKQKLEIYKCSDIKKELCDALDYIKRLPKTEENSSLSSDCFNKIQIMQNVIETLISKSDHSFQKFHPKNCTEYDITVPFTVLLKLVSRREVEVKRGKVTLPCGSWDELLEVIFQFFLQVELSLIENSKVMPIVFESEDCRIRYIITSFVSVLNGTFNHEKRMVKVDEIDKMSLYFPPCMANLHQILRQTHRLSYESRYQYTLFLRDIGVPVYDNISFWESEYNKPYAGSTCTHHWKDKEKKYKYQIEHIYGLTGSHDPKPSHSCEKFVNKLELKMDGGCPFQHFSREELQNALPKSVLALPDMEDMFTHKNNNLPQKACAVYLSCLKKVSSRQRENPHDVKLNFKQLYIVSPLQFFNIAKDF